MKAEYLNPFFLATQDVFRLMLDLETKRKPMRAAQSLVLAGDANVVIHVTGDLSGSILFAFPRDVILDMVRSMSGIEIQELDGFVSSALGEMANIVSGNALTNLHQSNIVCDISTPQILIGTNHVLPNETRQALVLPLETEMGGFQIALSLYHTG